MNHNYRVRPVNNIQEWDKYFDEVYQPHLTQSGVYGEAKMQTCDWTIKQLVFECGSTPVAICQILEWRLAGVRIAARINRGPLFIEAMPSYETKENVFRLLRKQWQFFVGGALLIAPSLEFSDENKKMLLHLGYKERKISGWRSSRIDLSPDEAAIRKGFYSTWRNRLQSSLKCGLKLQVSNSVESVHWIVEKHQENMCEKNFKGPSKTFIAALHASRPDDFLVLQAVFEGAVVGGLVVSKFGRHAENLIAWIGHAGRPVNCGNFLYWNAILQMKKAGCLSIDLGGYSCSDKFGNFKKNMRGVEYCLIGEWLAY